MDWIERWFSWIPDGGDGSLEILIAVFASIAGVVLLAAVARRHPLIAAVWRAA